MNMVYNIEIPLWNENARSVIYKEIKDVKAYINLLPFYFVNYKKKFSISEDLAEDLLYEFSLTPEDRESMRKISPTTFEELFAR